jgi:hypothetical protein
MSGLFRLSQVMSGNIMLDLIMSGYFRLSQVMSG